MADIAVRPDAELMSTPSFGGRTLAQNMAAAEIAIAKLAPLERVFNRSQSQWMRRHLTFSWWSIYHNARQVTAEISAKREALAEARGRLFKRQADLEVKLAEIDLLREEAAGMTGARLRLAEAKIVAVEVDCATLTTEIVNSIKYVEGALKDVLAIEKLYDELVVAHGRPFTEEDFERAEQKSQLARAFSQSLRDIRSTGRISNGDQEYMEQCGVNPSAALADCLDYLSTEAKGPVTTEGLAHFLAAMTEKYEPCGDVAARLRGFTTSVRQDALYTLEADRDR